MPHAELVIGGLMAVGVLASLAARFNVPHAVVVVLGGLALGFVPGTPAIRLDPDVIFLIFLPPLIYAASFTFAAEDLKSNVRPIGFLAVGLVLATVGVVAVAAHVVIGLAWPAAFVLGAVVSPTDPVAATGVLREIGAPGRLATILEGESLINDGTALSVFKLAAGALGAAAFHAWSGALEFVWIVCGGTAIGLACGWISHRLRERVDGAQLEITLGLVTTYGAFFVADEIGVSGILASVAAGIWLGLHSMDLSSAEARLQTHSFWDTATFITESLLFLLIGLAFQDVVGRLDAYSAGELVGYSALVLAAIIATRFLWMFTVPYVLGVLERGEGVTVRASVKERVVLSTAGMRGAVTVAAALSVPTAVGGGVVHERDLIILLAYATVVGTLVVPALALPAMLRRLGLAQGEEQRQQAREARLQLARAALKRADEIAETSDVPHDVVERVRDAYKMMIRAEGPGPDREARDESVRMYRELRRAAVEAEREELARIREERSVPGDTLRQIEYELDLVEARLGSSSGVAEAQSRD
jgi:CPA1 family monovalent cation:H+ antiporter